MTEDDANGTDDWSLALPDAGSEPAFFALEAAAAEPYYEFVYGDDHALADALRLELFRRGMGDLASPFGHLLRVRGRAVAMAAFGAARDLKRSRMKAALALGRSTLLPPDPDVRRRMQQAAGVMIELIEPDFYISRFAVAESERGSGIAQRLLDDIERRGRAAGCDSVALEVSTRHVRGIRFWNRAGFREVGRARVQDAERGVTLEYLHMRKPLPGAR